jgi:hypothetical protein
VQRYVRFIDSVSDSASAGHFSHLPGLVWRSRGRAWQYSTWRLGNMHHAKRCSRRSWSNVSMSTSSHVDLLYVVVGRKYRRKQTENRNAALESLGTFLVTMAHDWSRKIGRKTVSSNTNNNVGCIYSKSAVYNPKHLPSLPDHPSQSRSTNTMPTIDLTSTTGIQQHLHAHGYTCNSVERLAEGFSGFVYRARLQGDSTSPSPSNDSKLTCPY